MGQTMNMENEMGTGNIQGLIGIVTSTAVVSMWCTSNPQTDISSYLLPRRRMSVHSQLLSS